MDTIRCALVGSVILAANLLACVSLARADEPDTLWTRTFGGANIDIAYDVQTTGDGGLILAGYTRSAGAGGHDLWLLKTDADGQQEWSFPFGGGDDDEGHAVWPTSDGGYVAAGFTESFGAGGKDAWVVKVDAAGDEDWTQTYGGANDDEAYAIQETSDGGLIIAGVTSSFAVGGRDLWLIKTDASGTTEWSRNHGGYGSDGAWSVSQTLDGGYILAGWTFSHGGGYLGNAWLVKTGTDGEIDWHAPFGGSGADRGYAVSETADGGYIMAGYTDSFGAGLYDLYLVKTDAGGTQEWSEPFGGSGRDYAYAVTETVDGGFLAAGYTLSYGVGGDDVFLVRTDGDGVLQWQATYGGSASDVAHGIVTTSDGGYAVVGHTLSYGAGLHDAWVLRLSAEGASSVEPHPVGEGRTVLDIRPRLFSKSTLIRFETPEEAKVTLAIHDVSGRRVRVLEQGWVAAGPRSVVWDGLGTNGRPAAPGVYFCRLETDGRCHTTRVVRVR